jgi:hypothetical protein
MASPPIPPSLEHLSTRPFSFYPPIINIEHNEWLYRKATWSEILVVNCKTGTEIWISRRFLGEVSRVEDPVLIVGLTRELEYKAGMIMPYQRRIIEMPVAVGGSTAPASQAPDRSSPAPIVGIRVASSTDARMFKLVGAALMIGMMLTVITFSVFRVGEVKQRFVFTGKDQSFLDLTGRDDYLRVVQKLGQPANDRWANEAGDIQYRALSYPDRGFTVILMGTDRRTALYIGALDDQWRPIHSVQLHSGGTTASLLRGLKRF